MSWGARSVFECIHTSGVTTPTMAVDLGRAWKHVYLVVPTMPSGSLYIKGSSDNDGKFFRIFESEDKIVSTRVTMPANTLLSPAAFMGDHTYDPILELPSLTVSTIVYAQGTYLGINYRRVYNDGTKVDWSISGTTGNRFAPLPGGFSGFKLELVNSQTADFVFTVHGDIHGNKGEFTIDSSTTQCIIEAPLHGLRFVKVENSSGCTDIVTTYKLICSD